MGRMQTGVNKEKAVSYFQVSNDLQDNNNLEDVILTALLNDFDK